MSFCGNCGNEIPEGMKFCPNCGTKVIRNETVNPMPDKDTVNPVSDNRTINPAQGKEIVNPAPDNTIAPGVMTKDPEPRARGIDRFGSFYGIVLMILSIAGLFAKPPLFMIILSTLILSGCIFCLTKKYRFKGFSIVAIIISSLCLLEGVLEARQDGFLTSSYGSGSEISEDAGGSRSNFLWNKNGSNEKASKDVTYGRLTLTIPGKYLEKVEYNVQSNAENNANAGPQDCYYTRKDRACLLISIEEGGIPSDRFNAGESRENVAELMKGTQEEILDDPNEENTEYGAVAGLDYMKMTYSGTSDGQRGKCNIACINDETGDNIIILIHFYDVRYVDEYADDFENILKSARLNDGPTETSEDKDTKGTQNTKDTDTKGPQDTKGNKDTKDTEDNKDNRETQDTKEDKKEQSENRITTGGVDPNLKAFLDEYEAFINDYIDCMTKYMSDPEDPGNALSMMGDYLEMLSKYSDFDTKVRNLDTTNMSAADYAYYLEVVTRVEKRMLELIDE